MGYQPTTEVTAEQVFAWAQERWDADMAAYQNQGHGDLKGYRLPPMRRGYMGLVRMAEGGGDIEAYQDAAYARGYRVIYWRFVDGRPREVCAVEKADAAERAHWGKPAPERKPGPHVCSRMRDAMKERS